MDIARLNKKFSAQRSGVIERLKLPEGREPEEVLLKLVFAKTRIFK